MSKLASILNEFYATEDLSVSEQVYAMKVELDSHDFADEMVKLMHHLEEVVE